MRLIRDILKSDFAGASHLMGEMHGLPQKLGQHLNLYQAAAFSGYFDSLCAAGRTELVDIQNILRGLSIADATAPASIVPAAQASIGQVFRVQTADGGLAVKVRYPGVERRINGDFRLLGGLLWPLRLTPLRNNGLWPLLGSLRQLLLEECDYRKEAENQQRFYRLFSREAGDSDRGDTGPAILVPEALAFNDRAIASRWLDGTDLTCLSGRLDNWFIENYLAFILKSLKNLGLVHADPHPGNFMIIDSASGGKKLAVLDYGSVAGFGPEEAGAVARLLLGEYESEAGLFHDLRVLGVDGEALEIYGPVAGDLVSILLEPFYFPGDYSFAGWRMQYKMNTLLASRSWEKPLALPPGLFLLVRTLQGLYFYARNNNIVINWHAAVRNCLLQGSVK